MKMHLKMLSAKMAAILSGGKCEGLSAHPSETDGLTPSYETDPWNQIIICMYYMITWEHLFMAVSEVLVSYKIFFIVTAAGCWMWQISKIFMRSLT